MNFFVLYFYWCDLICFVYHVSIHISFEYHIDKIASLLEHHLLNRKIELWILFSCATPCVAQAEKGLFFSHQTNTINDENLPMLKSYPI